MPWTSPTLEDVRKQTRDYVTGKLRSTSMIPNSVLRVMSDAMGGLAYLVLLFVKWLSDQILPDTAEKEWLDRHAVIWGVPRQAATRAEGTATVTGLVGKILPVATQFASAGIVFETTEEITIGPAETPVAVRALDGGVAGNLDTGSALTLVAGVPGVDAQAVVVSLAGGADTESDDSLRERVLFRIQRPPMGGDADDYVAWAREVPGVTRAWCAPNEMGIGTVTVRFMMDELRASDGGFPNGGDVAAVQTHLDLKRPVAVKDFFVVAPVAEPINFTISNLVSDDAATRAAIAASVAQMIADKAAPAHAINGVRQDAQTIYREWVSAAILSASGVEHFDLTMSDHPMPNAGCLATRGTVSYP